MAEVPINLRVAQAIIEAGYMVGDDQSRIRANEGVADSPYYLIFKYIPKDYSKDKFLSLFRHCLPDPWPVWIGTIYFEKRCDIYESRFATDGVWVIVAEEKTYEKEMETLAENLTLYFNPTKVFLKRLIDNNP